MPDYREQIREQIRQHGGFSIWWITANQRRAKAATQMRESGEILTDNDAGFRWVPARIAQTQPEERPI